MACRHEISLVCSKLEDSKSASVVCNHQCLTPGHHLKRRQLESTCAFVAVLALVSQRLVEALGHVYELGIPSVAKVAPDINTQV